MEVLMKICWSSKTVKPTSYYFPLHYLLSTANGEPRSYKEALQVHTREKWEQAMDAEMQFLLSNQT